MLRLSIFLAVVLCASTALGKTIYVNPSNVGHGPHLDGLTAASAISDLYGAFLKAEDGDTIVIVAGRHPFHFNDERMPDDISVTITGERGPNGEFRTVLIPKRDHNEVIHLTSMKHVHFTNLEFLGCAPRGVFVANSGRAGVSMTDVYFHGCQGMARSGACVDILLKTPGRYSFDNVALVDTEINGYLFKVAAENGAIANVRGIDVRNVNVKGNVVDLHSSGAGAVNVNGIYGRDIQIQDTGTVFTYGSNSNRGTVKDVNFQNIERASYCAFLFVKQGTVAFEDIVINGCTSTGGIAMFYVNDHATRPMKKHFEMSRFRFNDIMGTNNVRSAISFHLEGPGDLILSNGVIQNTDSIDVKIIGSERDVLLFENVVFKDSNANLKDFIRLQLGTSSPKVAFHNCVFQDVSQPTLVASPLCGDIQFSNIEVINRSRMTAPFAITRASATAENKHWFYLSESHRYHGSHTECSKCNSCDVDYWSVTEPLAAGCQGRQHCFDGSRCFSSDKGHMCPPCPRGYSGDGLECQQSGSTLSNIVSRVKDMF